MLMKRKSKSRDSMERRSSRSLKLVRRARAGRGRKAAAGVTEEGGRVVTGRRQEGKGVREWQ